MRVRVHFNLHRKDFSVIDPKIGRVIGNVGVIALAGVEFRVSEHARQKVLRSKVRSVHAYAIGTMCVGPDNLDGLTAITYNPYRAGHFHVKDHPDQPIRKADVVVFSSGYCWIKLSPKPKENHEHLPKTPRVLPCHAAEQTVAPEIATLPAHQG